MPILRTRAPHGVGVGVAAATAVVLGLLLAPPAAAAPGSARPPNSWGAGSYSYLDGVVCRSLPGTPAQLSTPLVSWDLGSAGAPAYLSSPVTSAAGIDSAVPPLPVVGPQAVRNVVPGDQGFASDSDIATVASLIERFGSGGGAEQTAEVAHAVLSTVSGSGAAAVPACDDPGAEADLVHEAAGLAGPYTVTVDAGRNPVLPGTAQTVTATVHSAAGEPVPDAQVRFAAPGGDLSAESGTTGPDGTARVQLTVRLGTNRPSVPVRASTALPIGLDEVTATTAPSATDPTGSVAPALVVADPVEVSATAKVRVDRSAAPVLHVRAQPTALVVGSSSTPRIHVTGMYGHRATVHIVVSGPAPLSKRSLCSSLDARDFAGAEATTYTVETTGDVSTTAGAWTPQRPGCYRVSAALTTEDAVPRTSAEAVSSTPVTVLATTATATPAVPLVSPGDDATGGVRLTDSYGLGGTVHVRLVGPVRPAVGNGQCTGIDFADAPVGPVTTARLPADHTDPITRFSLRTSTVGCYRASGTAVLRLPDGAAVRVPISAAAARPVLAIAPRISYSMTRIWAYEHGAVSARATVIGTFGAPAHVALRLQRAPDSPLGCRSASFGGAVAAVTGPAVPVDGDLETVSVSSGPLASRGCYAPVAVLTMDANPSVTAASRFVRLRSAVEVGVDPRNLGEAYTIEARVAGGSPPIQWWSALAFGVLAGAALGLAWVAARRERAGSGRSAR